MTELVFETGPAGIGVSGLEAVHQWDDGIMLNDRKHFAFDDPQGPLIIPQLPVYKLKRIGGLFSRADFDDNRQNRTGQTGEFPRTSFKRGKTLTYEGTILATNLHQLRAEQGRLAAAFAPDDERTMVVRLDNDYVDKLAAEGVGDSVLQYQFDARCIDLAMDDDFSNTARTRSFSHGFESDFVISLRMSDPRFYDVEVKEEHIYPWLPQPVTIPHRGNAPTDPVITLWGPYAGGGIIVNGSANDAYLDVHAAASPEGGFFQIDFATRQITNALGGDARSILSLANSTWWDSGVAGLMPGDNLLTWALLIGQDFPTNATVSWHDAYWG